METIGGVHTSTALIVLNVFGRGIATHNLSEHEDNAKETKEWSFKGAEGDEASTESNVEELEGHGRCCGGGGPP